MYDLLNSPKFRNFDQRLNTPHIMSPSRFAGSGFDDTGLKAYYKFNEASGTLVNQSVSAVTLGTAADGTASGSPLYAQTGKIGDAISFDGTDDYFKLGTSKSQFNFLHNGTAATVVFWMKLSATDEATLNAILNDGNTTGASVQFGIHLDDTGLRDHKMQTYTTNGTAGKHITTVDSFIPKNTTTWYQYIYTESGSDTMTVYRDNANVETNANAYTHSSSDSVGEMHIGSYHDQSSNFTNGLIDEMSIWSREITSDERTSIYNSGNGLEIY